MCNIVRSGQLTTPATPPCKIPCRKHGKQAAGVSRVAGGVGSGRVNIDGLNEYTGGQLSAPATPHVKYPAVNTKKQAAEVI